MKITGVRHAWPERKGFLLHRSRGLNDYTFLHFWKPVKLIIGESEVLTHPNAVIIIDKLTPHHFTSPNVDLVHDWFHFSGDDARETVLGSGLEFNTVYYPKTCGFITDFVKTIEAEFFGGEKHSAAVMDSTVRSLLLMIDRRNESSGDELEVDYQTQADFKALRRQVFSSLDKNWTIAHMAERVNLSESRFYALYKATFKTTPNQDLIVARMDYAKAILSQNHMMPIGEVAVKCGYANEFHFIRQFKAHVGMTPKKYALYHRQLETENKADNE